MKWFLIFYILRPNFDQTHTFEIPFASQAECERDIEISAGIATGSRWGLMMNEQFVVYFVCESRQGER